MRANLIYGPQCKNISEEESDSSISDSDKIPTGGSQQYWQYAHHQFQQKMCITKGKGREKGKKRINSDHKNKKVINIDNFNCIEYLLVASTTSLLQKVWAAIYLSLEELWPTLLDLV
ncbi:zinc finger bed domain-containing protein 4-like [Gigaspora margarita]|uniref:Zinc finger bed domain-containing protein 4-like n=1 Tax=Gigaspora margarita TaxID=4874 RepID=A0A8H3WUY1_GIGMA|nr:zinc finger bed domain-containing protein 4-like [Gigaspora margarita]KAF0332892.1 zinc finger bed domain-containing protein 4-like [Gigaspora margarita]